MEQGDNRRNRGTIEEALQESLLEKTNFWQNVLERLVNVTLMLAKCNLPFREFSEELLKDNKGHFLSIIQLFAKYVLVKLLQLSKGSRKYLSPLIQNQLMLSDPKKRFCVTVFLPMMDILSCQLINCFEGMKSVVTSYQLLETSFLSNASHLGLEVEARKFSNKFFDNVSPLFPSQMLSIKTSFRERLPI